LEVVFMRLRPVIKTATIASSLIVLVAPVLAVGLMVWQASGTSSLNTAEARAIFEGRAPR
jgi:hypothetical protein